MTLEPSEDRGSCSGRKRIRNQELIDRIRDDVENSPKRSSRKRCQVLGIKRGTLLNALTEDLKKYPYHIQTHQKLTPNDMKRREAMAVELMDKIEDNKTFLPYLFTSDEAHFYLDGQVNSKNNVYWGSERPNEVSHKPQHSPKVTAWCTMSTFGIIGPFFFEENGGAVTINAERYIKLLEKFYNEVKTRFPSYLVKLWFQQDGSSPTPPI